MERTPAPERLTAALRRHPFAVDAALTAALVLFTVLLPAPASSDEAAAVSPGLLIAVPLAWRRKAPIPAAAVMIVAGLVQLVVSTDLLAADLAVLPMIYALAAYAPRWAGRAGLAIGLLGALLAGLRFYSYGASDALLASVFSGGIAVVAAWALGDLRRARAWRVAALEERARLLELERDQEMRLAATAERVVPAVPWLQVVAIVAVATLAGLLASVLPARRAARTAPVAAMG